MNLADVMGAADQFQEPVPDQIAILDGAREVQMCAVLDRTAVIELDGDRVLVALHRLDVDPQRLLWQKKPLQASEAFRLRRSARLKSVKSNR